MRHRITTSAVSFLFLVLTSNAWAAVKYTVTDLGALPGFTNSRTAAGINIIGQIVGTCNSVSVTSHAFFFSGGSMQDIGTLGGPSAGATGINDIGQVVGTAYITSSIAHAYLYSGGSMHDLGTLSSSYSNGSEAYAINNSGQIVGVSNDHNFNYHGFLYSGGTMQDLGTLGGVNTYATAINNNGQVAGRSQYTDQNYRAFIYSAGSMQNLGLPPSGLSSEAWGINDLGQVVGDAVVKVNNNYVADAMLYSGGTWHDLGSLAGYGTAQALAINNYGEIVGELQQPSSGGYNHAFLDINGSMEDLNDLVSPPSGWTIEIALDVNDNGLIVGRARDSGGGYHAILLTPVPEPSSFALLFGGAVGLLALAWRRMRHAT
jgi:probable HAF family extracellular repeat protein